MQALGIKEKTPPPEEDDRTQFWTYLFWITNRGRPYTYTNPLPLRPLDCLDIVERLGLPAHPYEVIEVITAMDEKWLDWWSDRHK